MFEPLPTRFVRGHRGIDMELLSVIRGRGNCKPVPEGLSSWRGRDPNWLSKPVRRVCD